MSGKTAHFEMEFRHLHLRETHSLRPHCPNGAADQYTCLRELFGTFFEDLELVRINF